MKNNKNFMPVLIDLSGKRILIIGGGNSAFKKLLLLQRFTSNIDVLALRVNQKIKENGAKWKEKAYDALDLKGYFMVYSCSNNPETDNKIIADARHQGLLVNIHDRPALCDFVSPAIYKKGDLTVSVGSNAKNVYRSIKIRDSIQTYLESTQLL